MLAGEPFGEEPRVVLAKSAMDRFDRLADRLEWVVLNTIQGHLEEITALSDTVRLYPRDTILACATDLADPTTVFQPHTTERLPGDSEAEPQCHPVSKT